MPAAVGVVAGDLRDWFAGQIAAGYLAAHAGDETSLPKQAKVADYAYSLADALLARREQQTPAETPPANPAVAESRTSGTISTIDE